jgi:5,10-methylenetetrahydromethanopterin reductase
MGIGMRIGINGTGNLSDLDGMIRTARRAEADGFDSFWIAQIFGLDALTALAVVGREVPRIELGTAVVPTFPRHPMMLGGQALTVQAAIGDRLALGIGLSHQIVVEHMWGHSWAKPVRHMREYLDALLPLLRGEAADVRGEDITCVGALDIPGVAAPPVIVAALGSQMLEVAGSRGCGTITWCTGEKVLGDHIVPGITAAAEAAGQPSPRVVAGLPVSVTSDPDAAKALVAEQFVLYGGLPSYRSMLDMEGVAGPEDVAVIGDEGAVEAALRRLADRGVTDFSAVITAASKDDHERTWRLLAELNR